MGIWIARVYDKDMNHDCLFVVEGENETAALEKTKASGELVSFKAFPPDATDLLKGFPLDGRQPWARIERK